MFETSRSKRRPGRINCFDMFADDGILVGVIDPLKIVVPPELCITPKKPFACSPIRSYLLDPVLFDSGANAVRILE